MYGYILAGEIAGTAAGFAISGTVASLIPGGSAGGARCPASGSHGRCRAPCPSPERGGQSRLAPGAEEFVAAPDEQAPGEQLPGAASRVAEEEEAAPEAEHDRDLAREAAQRGGVRPNPRLVLRSDPRQMGLFRAIGYVMRVPTNVLLIIGSSLGYFYFAGLQTFALVFLRGHYQASEATATLVLLLLVLGALVGTLASGPATDALVKRDFLKARVWLPGLCYSSARRCCSRSGCSTTT